MTSELQRTNRDQADRARQGLFVFSGLGQRDLFASDTIEKTTQGWRLLLRNPWYTGTHLSTVAVLRLEVNGRPVPPEHTFIALRGQTIPAAFAKNLHELFWGMGEVAEVFLTDPALDEGIGENNEIAIEIDMRTTFSYGFPNDTLPYRLSGQLKAA